MKGEHARCLAEEKKRENKKTRTKIRYFFPGLHVEAPVGQAANETLAYHVLNAHGNARPGLGGRHIYSPCEHKTVKKRKIAKCRDIYANTKNVCSQGNPRFLA
jgi:hypothetical protein